jgi:hypothetical protein
MGWVKGPQMSSMSSELRKRARIKVELSKKRVISVMGLICRSSLMLIINAK